MSLETLRVTASRIAEHAVEHRLPAVRIILHGGEPLLAGVATMRAMITILRATIEPVTVLRLGMQTNAVQLTPRFCDLFSESGVRIGVSLDGDREANDLHRVYANGSSSHDKVLQALRLLRLDQYRHLYAGLLCTIDIRNDPIRVYESLLAEEPPRVDFLLPHATWDNPPLRFADDPTPYATWLGRIHKRWLADGQPFRVKTFESLATTAEGGRSGTEQFGLESVDLAVVETNGDWEQADSLKTSFDGAPATGLTVFSHSVDEVAELPELARRQGGLAVLNQTCRACPVVRQCGGGLFAHRYSVDNGFDNPSVYCADLKEFIVDMNHATAQAALPAGLLEAIGRGTNDGLAVEHLAHRQLSINRDLLEAIGAQLDQDGLAADGWDLLQRLDVDAPDATDGVLSHPYIRPWAVRCLNGDADSPDDSPGDSDVNHWDYLCAIAAAVAIRSGQSAEIRVPLRDGALHLPTVGSATVTDSRTADLIIEPGRLTITAGGQRFSCDPLEAHEDLAWWRPARYWRHEDVNVLIEDGDPYRDCHNWQPAGTLSPPDAEQWCRALDGAWRLIETEIPQYASGLRAGLRAVVPLIPSPAGSKAATARHAFGSVAATPAPPDTLAVLLVHEFHHGKLGALLDLVDLFDRDNLTKLYVGWREDLRPIEGVLQGTYAHLAVADVWRGRAAGGPRQTEAEKNYLQYRDWTFAAIDTLKKSGALTELGERFLDHMAGELESWDS